VSRPRIGVDADGVVVNWNDKAAELMGLAERWGAWGPPEWDTLEKLNKKAFDLLWEEPLLSEMFREAAPLPNALETLQELSKVADVWIVSSRPGGAWAATKSWLRRHDVEVKGVRLVEGWREKAGVVKALGLRAFIDDKEETVRDLHSKGVLSFLMERNYNKGMDYPQRLRVRDLPSFKRKLERLGVIARGDE